MKKKYVVVGIGILLLLCILVVTLNRKTSQTVIKPHKLYIALGDSVSAGVGLQDYSDSSACDRTIEAYPNIVGTNLDLNTQNISCSGATFASGILGNQDVNQLSAQPQLKQLFVIKNPYLITLTAGANDIGWTDYIAQCYTGVCGSDADTATIDLRLISVASNLNATLSQIRDHYKTSLPRVLVTGYYQVFPVSTSNCNDITGIDQNELSWGRQQQQKLNATIEQVTTQFSFAKFVAINFSGHELCSADPWVQGINDSAPYHPTDEGQKAISQQLISTYKTFK